MQDVPEAPRNHAGGARHQLLVLAVAADGAVRAIEQYLHAGAGETLPLEHPAFEAGDVCHPRIKYVQERAAEALVVAGHEGEEVHTHLHGAEVSGLTQGDGFLYVLVHFNVVVACIEGGRGKGVSSDAEEADLETTAETKTFAPSMIEPMPPHATSHTATNAS